MTNGNGHKKEDLSAYPGEYKSLPFSERERKEELDQQQEGASQPVANIIECADHYRIEIVAPGHTKDDFIITIDKGQLSVFAGKQKSKGKEQSSFYRSHKFNYDCFEHNMPVPEKSDADFAKGEYRAGILSICLPKTDKPVLNAFHQVVVY